MFILLFECIFKQNIQIINIFGDHYKFILTENEIFLLLAFLFKKKDLYITLFTLVFAWVKICFCIF